jgi:hypothetical protein
MGGNRIGIRGDLIVRYNDKDYSLSSSFWGFEIIPYLKEVIGFDDMVIKIISSNQGLDYIKKALTLWKDKNFKHEAYYYNLDLEQQYELNQLLINEVHKIVEYQAGQDLIIEEELMRKKAEKARRKAQRAIERAENERVAKALTDLFCQDITQELLKDCTAEEEQAIIKTFEENALSLMPEYFDYEYYEENPDEQFYLSDHFYENPLSIYNIVYEIALSDVKHQTNYLAVLNNAFFSMYRLELPKEDREAHTIIVAGSGSVKI